MQVTKGTRRMREQCVPGSLSSSPAQEPGNEANILCTGNYVGACICSTSCSCWLGSTCEHPWLSPSWHGWACLSAGGLTWMLGPTLITGTGGILFKGIEMTSGTLCIYQEGCVCSKCPMFINKRPPKHVNLCYSHCSTQSNLGILCTVLLTTR